MSELAGASDATLIIVALISALPAMFVAWLNKRSHKATREKVDDNTKKTSAVLHQVQNDHNTNLRDDLDAFKDDVTRKLESIEAAQGYLGRLAGNLLHDVKQNIRNQRDHDVASALVVSELRKRDEELRHAIDEHHPKGIAE